MIKAFNSTSSILLLAIAFHISSCHQNAAEDPCPNPPCDESLLNQVNFYTVSDLNFNSFQNAESITSTYYNKTYDPGQFLDSFFMPWKFRGISAADDADKIWNELFTYENGIAKNRRCNSGNNREYSDRYLSIIRSNIPRRSENSLQLKGYGITTGTTDQRTLPTDEFCFKNIRNPGEGYPFDYLQQTTLWVGTPVSILEYSIDKEWYLVLSPYGIGWVKSSLVAHTTSSQRNKILTANKVVIMNDDLLIKNSKFIYRLFAGTILPTNDSGENILIPRKSHADQLILDPVNIKTPQIEKFPVEFNEENVKMILSTMIEGKYSWGGLGGGRDCSATLRDYFAAFGIWLPRNSKQQRFSGTVTDISAQSREDKVETIINQGLPYLSTLYMPGHIVLYVGQNQNETLQIYHTVWGLKPRFSSDRLSSVVKSRGQLGLYGVRARDQNQVETRIVIGKTVITDIEPEARIQELENIWVLPFLENMECLTNIAVKN